MTVKEFALFQLHWIIRKDPWVQSIFNAAGISLNDLAERIVACWNFNDFEKLTEEQCEYYESLLGITSDSTLDLDDRRAAIQMAWNGSGQPSLTSIQTACDAWEAGGIVCSYSAGTLTLTFVSSKGVPSNLSTLQSVLASIVPAHIIIDYAFNYMLIEEIHEVLTLDEMGALTIDKFAFD